MTPRRTVPIPGAAASRRRAWFFRPPPGHMAPPTRVVLASVAAVGVVAAACGGPAPGPPTGATPTSPPPSPTAAATATRLPEGSFAVGVPGPSMSGCLPTIGDTRDEQYVPGAPETSVLGSGYSLQGTVLAAGPCGPVAGALVELWMHGAAGATRAGAARASPRGSTSTDEAGAFAFETDRPVPVGDESPHLHLRVSAPDFEPVFLRHYPAPGSPRGAVAVVLKPE